MPDRKNFHGENSYFGEGGYLDQQNSGTNSRPTPIGGQCADCGGTGDCIHCEGGYYTRKDALVASVVPATEEETASTPISAMPVRAGLWGAAV